MAFVFEPSAAKDWSKGVLEYLNGGSVSIKGCTDKFYEQIEKLIQPNVWTGAAAIKNLENFMTAHTALIKFTNSFGQTFSESMHSIAQAVNDLEISNLGTDTTVSATFSNEGYSAFVEQQASISERDVVRYDYGVISEIGANLANIKTNLESVADALKSKMNQIGDGSGIWEGKASEEMKTELNKVVDDNMKEILPALEICIKNISTAAEAAQYADGN